MTANDCLPTHLHAEELVDVAEARVPGERLGAELDGREGAEQDEDEVEEERVHVRAVDLQWTGSGRRRSGYVVSLVRFVG